jgi:hypothetical protein
MSDGTTATAAATNTPAAQAPPVAPATSQQAAARLAELRETPEWGVRLLAQDPTTLAEFHAVSKLVAQGDPIDIVMSGEAAGLPNSSRDGKPSLAATAREIPALREAGISDGAIRELLENRIPTPAEIDAVSRFQKMRHGDPAWVTKYLAGDFDARREGMLMSMVLMMRPT